MTDPLEELMGGDEEGPEYELVMPFVVCKSQGGAYDDDAFAAGATFEQVWQRIKLGQPDVLSLFVPVQLVPQLELIAMKEDYAFETEPHDEDWTLVRFLLHGLKEAESD